ncbi:unnamed protein product [Brachionus calyciflorus]|uniref:Helitron helicase-like domain-containing protein n=1 Tax=Brachionus calyciflorus TaxID=104777 RepID=A0A814F0N8_9BILA|nr:unnamed protein product [Brachionus calyciflorus]
MKASMVDQNGSLTNDSMKKDHYLYQLMIPSDVDLNCYIDRFNVYEPLNTSVLRSNLPIVNDNFQNIEPVELHPNEQPFDPVAVIEGDGVNENPVVTIEMFSWNGMNQMHLTSSNISQFLIENGLGGNTHWLADDGFSFLNSIRFLFKQFRNLDFILSSILDMFNKVTQAELSQFYPEDCNYDKYQNDLLEYFRTGDRFSTIHNAIIQLAPVLFNVRIYTLENGPSNNLLIKSIGDHEYTDYIIIQMNKPLKMEYYYYSIVTPADFVSTVRITPSTAANPHGSSLFIENVVSSIRVERPKISVCSDSDSTDSDGSKARREKRKKCYHPFVRLYKSYKDRLDEFNGTNQMINTNLRMYLHTNRETGIADLYRANTYTATAGGVQIGAFFTSDTDSFPSHQFVAIQPFRENLNFLYFQNPLVDPLCYPLLFLHGTPGYSGDIPHNRASLLKLLQQYMVDAYVKTERNRLDYIEANQHTLRRDSYTGLTDYLRTVAEEENRDVGSIYILPSTFTGSERYMR